MASEDTPKDDVHEAPVPLSAQLESLRYVLTVGAPVCTYTDDKISSLSYFTTSDVVYLERAKVLLNQALPYLKDRLPKNENLKTLMYADGELSPDDCTDALAEVKVRPMISFPYSVHTANLYIHRTCDHECTMPSVTRLSCATSSNHTAHTEWRFLIQDSACT